MLIIRALRTLALAVCLLLGSHGFVSPLKLDAAPVQDVTIASSGRQLLIDWLMQPSSPARPSEDTGSDILNWLPDIIQSRAIAENLAELSTMELRDMARSILRDAPRVAILTHEPASSASNAGDHSRFTYLFIESDQQCHLLIVRMDSPVDVLLQTAVAQAIHHAEEHDALLTLHIDDRYVPFSAAGDREEDDARRTVQMGPQVAIHSTQATTFPAQRPAAQDEEQLPDRAAVEAWPAHPQR